MKNKESSTIPEDHLSKMILGAAIKIHRSLGPGLLESAYQKCLVYELQKRDLFVESEKTLPVIYDGIEINVGYRLDLLINQKVIIEIKSVEKLNEVHLAQLLTYLKLSDCKLGLLINFNRRYVKDGFRRVVNNL